MNKYLVGELNEGDAGSRLDGLGEPRDVGLVHCLHVQLHAPIPVAAAAPNIAVTSTAHSHFVAAEIGEDDGALDVPAVEAARCVQRKSWLPSVT